MDWVMILFLLVCIGAWCEVMEKRSKDKEEQERREQEWEAQWEPDNSITIGVTNQEDGSAMTQKDWNVICRTAIEEAKAGDPKARDWVVKNVTTEAEESCPFISDAIDALVQLGHKETEARKIVLALTSENTYNSLDDLIRDALSNK